MTASKLAQSNSFRSLIGAIILTAITAYLLVVVGKSEPITGINQILIVISGMTTIAALASFKQFIQSSTIVDDQVDEVNFSFDEAFATMSISQGKKDTSTNVIINQTYQVSTPPALPWDLSLNQLIGADNTLALAKLRIEIERELRRIAYENGIDIGIRPIGILSLAEELFSLKVLPGAWLEVLKEIVPVCNEAIHGLELSDEMAISIVRVGGQLLEQLRLVSQKDLTHS